jgi:hypothetical protein
MKTILILLLAVSSYVYAEQSKTIIDFSEFHKNWKAVEYPETIYAPDGSYMAKHNALVTIRAFVSKKGDIQDIQVFKEAPVGKGYGKVVADYVRKIKLEPVRPADEITEGYFDLEYRFGLKNFSIKEINDALNNSN